MGVFRQPFVSRILRKIRVYFGIRAPHIGRTVVIRGETRTVIIESESRTVSAIGKTALGGTF